MRNPKVIFQAQWSPMESDGLGFNLLLLNLGSNLLGVQSLSFKLQSASSAGHGDV
jgi:hypothetical protein